MSSNNPVTVHMIGNAHLDPIWLWRKSDGVDTVLATARSACDRLDEYPEFIFTCSTRWFHETVQQLDPELFERVRAFVRAGRWQLVGGMVVQPDCNLPSAESFRRQLEVGQAYYRDAFGRATTVGYNVDSFGHTAYLPTFLREAGIDAYVMMRPHPHEKTLPANLFRWRSPDGREVTAFRIRNCYTTREVEIFNHVKQSLENLPDGVTDTMCFFGVGDHGGGPTKAQIEWIQEHADAVDGAKLMFSHPRAFFDALAPRMDALPVVADELQHHAIGCYSIERKIKLGMFQAERSLVRARRTMELFPERVTNEERRRVEQAQEIVLFNQFHDTLGGTCLADANLTCAAEFNAAASTATDVTTDVTRRALRREAEPGLHKIVVFNPAEAEYTGPIRHEPWLEYDAPKNSDISLYDESGRKIPSQLTGSDSLAGVRGLLWMWIVPAGEYRTFLLRKDANQTPDAKPTPAILSNVDLAGATVRGDAFSATLEVCDDPTDTWSHSAIDRFGNDLLGQFAWTEESEPVETGPIRWTRRASATFGNSRAWLRLSAVEGEPFLRLGLSVVWAQAQQRLRLRIDLPGAITARTDWVSGGPLPRRTDGKEYPWAGISLLGNDHHALGVVAPDVTSISVEGNSVNLTLLRGPYVAHHDPAPITTPEHPVTDQGTHTFAFAIYPHADTERLEELHRQLTYPPMVWDLTG
ncbi:MAG: hypothetical protein JXA11_10340 [Phycisphaerae bacterium]|nr:hypothetical protein [Phycisphaerae bacterium]